MSKARVVLALQLSLGCAGIAATAMALLLASSSVTFSVASWHQVAQACRAFVLPQLSAGSILALILGIVALAVLLLAAHSALSQICASRRFLRRLVVLDTAPEPGGPTIFESSEPLAFCAGYLRPRIYVSTGALAALEPEELMAVLAHERHHACSRDPLRLFVARMLASSLFFLPALRRLTERAAALAELDADAAAVRGSAGDRRPLAGALLAFDERSSSAVVGIAAERVDHLMGEPVRWHLPVAVMLWTAALGALIVAVEVRAAQVDQVDMVSLPLLAAELCMFAMAAAPIVLGTGALLAGRRATRSLAR